MKGKIAQCIVVDNMKKNCVMILRFWTRFVHFTWQECIVCQCFLPEKCPDGINDPLLVVYISTPLTYLYCTANISFSMRTVLLRFTWTAWKPEIYLVRLLEKKGKYEIELTNIFLFKKCSIIFIS